MVKMNKYIERISKYCKYSPCVETFTKKLYVKIPSLIIPNQYLKYSCTFLILSKFIEDQIISLKEYSKITGIKYTLLIKYENELFNYLLKKINLFKFTNVSRHRSFVV